MAQGEGLYEVLERIGDNDYNLDLLGDVHVSATFNVSELAPYMDDSFEDLREKSFARGIG